MLNLYIMVNNIDGFIERLGLVLSSQILLTGMSGNTLLHHEKPSGVYGGLFP